MKFGIATFVTNRGIAPDPLATAVEERGFHSLIVAEHSHRPLAFEEPKPGAGELPPDLYRTLDPPAVQAGADQRRLPGHARRQDIRGIIRYTDDDR